LQVGRDGRLCGRDHLVLHPAGLLEDASMRQRGAQIAARTRQTSPWFRRSASNLSEPTSSSIRSICQSLFSLDPLRACHTQHKGSPASHLQRAQRPCGAAPCVRVREAHTYTHGRTLLPPPGTSRLSAVRSMQTDARSLPTTTHRPRTPLHRRREFASDSSPIAAEGFGSKIMFYYFPGFLLYLTTVINILAF
jgi:hypothetical protein